MCAYGGLPMQYCTAGPYHWKGQSWTIRTLDFQDPNTARKSPFLFKKKKSRTECIKESTTYLGGFPFDFYLGLTLTHAQGSPLVLMSGVSPVMAPNSEKATFKASKCPNSCTLTSDSLFYVKHLHQIYSENLTIIRKFKEPMWYYKNYVPGVHVANSGSIPSTTYVWFPKSPKSELRVQSKE